ncbi:hypothetical protein [Paraglaciecola sp. MB-3u-78]|uniref:hypothetical protein n=1 Tax=Paraglaciecola sp. MB-3u-78 TaxID=2058332 RepID=UPI000C34C166|nr:hypothetical protein [Paraglaciecola sp. MB-3u-78]PKG93312.1 hypothetical protein CXF95_27480 [Paraglaciecola sp. MB-3u-78]
MFWFKSKRGSLYKEYRKLAPENIVKRLNLSDIQPDQVVFTMYQLCLYGGLDLQNTLHETGIIESANQDSIFIEGVAYTWANLHWSIITDTDLAIYEDSILIQGMDVGGSVLAELLSKHSGQHLDKNFAAYYQAANMPKADEILMAKLLKLNGLESKDLLKDQVSVTMAIKIHSSTINQGLLQTAKRVVRFYLGLPIE